ncbi:excinuclease ABC subunit UvrC [Paraliomyxa miuraensis]|uniref:excinuclease ABC subunit UvrC n=1 Tax=Paraliomyxa miuraensis TaxID=376150 RepID=UPI00224E3D77|nr:excinuclease ABC subunit UvrC [Paraliomyxa miuraensis]MCX4241696.1 excinuclease ABC subunit UvrC [Paraliomyxa miuraensis]
MAKAREHREHEPSRRAKRAGARGRGRASGGAEDAAPGASVASTRRPSPAPAVPEAWQPRITDEAALEEALGRLPEAPGVYVMRDRQGHVIYVGKARRLRARVKQYFNGHDTRAFVPLLVKIVGDIETVVTANDKEALLLENNLIKEHRPRFNVKLRDDSNYLVIRLDPKQRWPRLELRRQIEHDQRKDGVQHFGPYHSASSARATLRVVNRHFQLRTCTDYVLDRRTRPCLQYQIERCPGPCVYEVDEAAYAAQVQDVGLFLSGRHRELTDGLRARMQAAAEGLDFEVAARLRDQIASIETTLTAQQVVGSAALDQDAIGMYREGGQVELVVLHVRQGKLLGTETHSATGLEHPDAEVLADFVSSYYARAPFIPDEVLLPGPIAEDDAEPLQEWLREQKGRKVTIATPERGDRRKLTRLADRNAGSNFVTRRNRREDSDAALARLQARLQLSKLPRVIECFDVSHIQGSDTVASMVVFVDGVADKSRYRSFRIKGIGAGTGADDEARLRQGAFQNDDFTSMYEVLGRRFRRALQGDDEAWALPDLMVIDGGKGQLGRVIAAMQDLGVPLGAEGVDVVALAKERKHALGHGRAALKELRARREAGDQRRYEDLVLADAVGEPGASEGTGDDGEAADQPAADDGVEVKPERVFVPGVKEAIRLRPGSSERYLMERVRDEAHRFAITHHRKRRGKRSLRSALDDIPGVGPALKKAMVKHFGSVGAIKAATVEQLGEVKGIGPALAARIRESLGGG